MTDGIHFLDARAPDGMRIYAIGDVHGRLDLLSGMHKIIAAEIERDQPADWRIIHLGDYVDRGPGSRGVLDLLVGARERDPRNIMLAGNHDVGLLGFIDHPEADSLFVRYGGIETARSYGVNLASGSTAALRSSHAALRDAVPQAHVDFLQDLPSSVSFGDFFFCHAGIRPGVPLAEQSPQDLMWIRDVFHFHAGLHPKVIVHGHTPHALPEVEANRVNVDTEAWQSGRLTALVVDGASKNILTIMEDGSVQRSEALTP